MTDPKSSLSTIPSPDFLIRGEDHMARKGDFQLIGRAEELKDASTVLMRKSNNNLVVYGQTGVGISSIVTGVQASKEDLKTPFEIVGKRFFWLDTDALFASGDATKINEGFQKTLSTLARSPDTVLVIDDIKDFLEGCKANGTLNLINGLMRELRNDKFQAIFECRSENLSDLFKSHSDVAEIFSFLEVREPGKDALKEILKADAKSLEAFHGVTISDDALEQVVVQTMKYPGLTLNTAQPKRSSMILEGALTAFRYKAHTKPLALDDLEETLAAVSAAIDTGAAVKLPHLIGKTVEELETIRHETTSEIRDINASWEAREKEIRKVHADQRIAEENIRIKDEEIASLRDREAFTKKSLEDFRKAEGDEAAQAKIKETFFGKYGEALSIPTEVGGGAGNQFSARLKMGGLASAAIDALVRERGEWEGALKQNKGRFDELTKGGEKLELNSDHVLAEFSRLSHIPMSKLQQDETAKLLNLEVTLKERVFGQDEPVEAIAKSVRRGRKGLKKANKPIGSFLFLGPSGVGKTELAKALAASLFGDERSLQVYDMSEYQEKHAGAVLIGAPPGYEGYAEGGILTNNMNSKPYCVNVFDEIEKAHKDVFDLFLQVIDEGRLTDRRGIPASFGNAINIMTSNIGSKYFLDENLDWEDAKASALKDLKDPAVGGFRPEFLNRFTGIFCFNRLGLPQIELIAGKSMKELNSWIAEQGLEVVISKEDKAAMCKDKYVPSEGGRGIMRYIEQTVTSDVAETMLRHPEDKGVIQVTYDRDKKEATTEFVRHGQKPQVSLPANENKNVPAPAPKPSDASKSAFKPEKSA